MIRVLHHLEYTENVLKEISRILKKDAYFILEYQNIRNIVERIKKLLRISKLDIDSINPCRIGEMYWNFHPDFIKPNVEKYFAIINELGGGIFWNRKVLTALLFKPEIVDSLLSNLFGKKHLTHQIFLKLKNINFDNYSNEYENNDLKHILKCVNCDNNHLEFYEDKIECVHCKKEYKINNNIYDFRI